MPRITVVNARDPGILLRHAADGFLERRVASAEIPFPAPDYLLCLRQGALRDDVISLAREAGVHGWFDAPLCIFHELPHRLGVSSPRAAGDYERLVILTELLRALDGGPLANVTRPDDFAADMDRLLGELIGEGISVEALENALHAERRERIDDGFESERDAGIVSVYREYRERLRDIGRIDPRESLVLAARAVANRDVSLAHALQGRREIRIFGLADLRGGWRALLSALAGSDELDRVTIYTSATLDLQGIPADIQFLDEPVSIALELFSDRETAFTDPDAAPRITHVVAPDLEREVGTIAVTIRALMDAGTAPHRIAIVARRARPNVDHAVRALATVGVPATARLRTALREVPLVHALSALLSAAADGWTRYGLTHVVRSPYIQCDVDPRIIDFIGYRRRVTGLTQWVRALDELVLQARQHEQSTARAAATGADDEAADARHAQLPTSADAQKARDGFVNFVERARVLDSPRTLAAWLRWLEDFLVGESWGVAARARELTDERYDIVRRDMAAMAALATIARDWGSAAIDHGSHSSIIDVNGFARALRPSLDTDLALATPTAFGVQVLEAPAAAYRSFDHVFIVGMQAGAFPTVPNRSVIWDEADRERLRAAGLALDGRDDWEIREQDLFRVIVAGARRGLTVSHARLDESGREVIASVFTEELADRAVVQRIDVATSDVAIADVPLYSSKSAPGIAMHGARIERIRATRATSAYNGSISHPELAAWLATEFGDERLWSPTQLEEMAKCPWSYMSRRLMGLRRLQDPDEDMDSSVRGTILHDALAKFYSAAIRRTGAPVFLLPHDGSWVHDALATALDSAIAGQSGTWLGHPSLRAARRDELARVLGDFIEWEIQLHADMTDPKTRKRNAPAMVRTGVSDTEVPFSDVVFERDGIRIRYHGTIDRVEVSVDERIGNVRLAAAADYKSTKGSTPGRGEKKAWADGVVIQVPLYAYALSQLHPDHEIARVEYLTLAKPDSVLPLQLYSVDRKSSELLQNDEAIADWQRALDHAVSHVKRARGGEFPAKLPATCSCPPWCHGIDICRLPKQEAGQ